MRKHYVALLAIFTVFYCIPQSGGYFCVEKTFEERSWKVTRPGIPKDYTETVRYKCEGIGESYRCKAFDPGAILLTYPEVAVDHSFGVIDCSSDICMVR